MAEPATPGEARRQGLRRTRWITAGASFGAAVLLTGTIAAVHAAPSGGSEPSDGNIGTGSNAGSRSYGEIDDDEYEDARPFTPQQQSPQPTPQQQAPQLSPQPQTRSRGS